MATYRKRGDSWQAKLKGLLNRMTVQNPVLCQSRTERRYRDNMGYRARLRQRRCSFYWNSSERGSLYYETVLATLLITPYVEFHDMYHWQHFRNRAPKRANSNNTLSISITQKIFQLFKLYLKAFWN